MRRAVSRLLLLGMLVWLAPSWAAAQPPLWIVRSHGSTVYLFGSVHLLPPGVDWTPAGLGAALLTANELWFEVPITAESDNAAVRDAEKRGSLAPGVTLTSLMTPDQAEKLRRVAASLHCSMEALDRMQPWRAEVILSVAADAQFGADESNGVEARIQSITPAMAHRRAFEAPRQQVDFLAGAPLADQLASLDLTLHDIEDDPGAYRRVVDEWLGADLAGLERDAITPLRRASPVIYERLIAARNRRWAKEVRKWLRQPGVKVVVVGAGHLIGPDGLPALLRAQGMRVDGP